MKKAAEAEKKEKARQEKVHKKGGEKSQLQDIRKIALANCQVKIDAFQAILFDPYAPPSSNLPEPSNSPNAPIIESTAAKISVLSNERKVLQQTHGKKQLQKANWVANLQKPVLVSLLLIQIELIRPEKQKVKITDNVVENTPPKQMQPGEM